ncbi:MAG: pyruvate ferredoxin oxidoreductase [Proteobacteria bacterium]|nr:pyruvate ferredoxin oxidoreductase [Pseudomonadota bacterium]
MKQQIVISGIGGQGVLFLTRIIAEAALGMELDILTSETHGMAQRGGTVISTVKIGPFRSSLVRKGHADIGLFLHASNLAVHRDYIKPEGKLYLNANTAGEYAHIDATAIAKGIGSSVLANLVLLGFAINSGGLFCDKAEVEQAIKRTTKDRLVEPNLAVFRKGTTFQG